MKLKLFYSLRNIKKDIEQLFNIKTVIVINYLKSWKHIKQFLLFKNILLTMFYIKQIILWLSACEIKYNKNVINY